MLATLLEASQPGQRRPSARDTRALIIGGLRVRATQDQRLTTAASLRLAAQLGAALTLLMLIAGNLTSAILIWAHIYAQNIGNGLWSAYGLLGLAAQQRQLRVGGGVAGAGVVYLRGGNGRIGFRLVLAAAPPGRALSSNGHEQPWSRW